jgi:hypothetical protein
LSVLTNHFTSERELDTSEQIISNLKVIESDISNSLGDSTISVILPSSKVVEVGGDWRILPVRV